jgi:hypothetical protein
MFSLYFLVVEKRFKTQMIALLIGFLVSISPSQAQTISESNIVDYMQVQDLLIRYYWDLSKGDHAALATYFTEDAMLDVDGTIANGLEEIEALYIPPADTQPREERGQGRMLFTNPIIEVEGNKATAHTLWTGVMNQGVGQAPTLYEQGREYTELLKINGLWKIKVRYVSSDSGLPDRFDQTFEHREHY